MKATPQTQVQTNFIKHQELFYEIVKSVDVIHCSHIALYQALFRCWNYHFFTNPVQFPREQIMGMAGIRSKSVYYKVIRELEALDLIRYYPSKSIYGISNFCLSTLEKVNDEIFISLWGLSNHQSLSQSENQLELFKDISEGPLKLMTNLTNGKGRVVLLKKYSVAKIPYALEAESNLFNMNQPEAYNPLTDPKYASHIDNRISSHSNKSNYANHQDSQSRGSSLRPSGVPVDPEADYSIKL